MQENKITKQYVQLWKSNSNNDNDINEDNSNSVRPIMMSDIGHRHMGGNL